MNTYLTANEANKIASEAQSIDGVFMRDQMNKIMEQISSNASAGNNTVQVPYCIHAVTEKRLIHFGYKIKKHSHQRDGDWTIISW